MSSNFISVPKAWDAAVAHSFPAASMGPMGLSISASILFFPLLERLHTCQDDKLFAMFIIKAMLSMSGQDVGSNQSHILHAD
jgi:hypothetical protein